MHTDDPNFVTDKAKALACIDQTYTADDWADFAADPQLLRTELESLLGGDVDLDTPEFQALLTFLETYEPTTDEMFELVKTFEGIY